jgi:hypothetical protein
MGYIPQSVMSFVAETHKIHVTLHTGRGETDHIVDFNDVFVPPENLVPPRMILHQ